MRTSAQSPYLPLFSAMDQFRDPANIMARYKITEREIIEHEASEHTGHGPGVNPLISAFPGRVRPFIDPKANIAYYLGLRPDLKW